MSVLSEVNIKKYKRLAKEANEFIGKGFFYAEEGGTIYIGRVKKIQFKGECIELVPKSCFQLSNGAWEKLDTPSSWDFNAVEQWGNLFKTTSETYCMTIRTVADISIYREQSFLIRKITEELSANLTKNLPGM